MSRTSIMSFASLARAALGLIAIAAPLAAPSSMALETARMRLPAELVGVAERLPARGYGGANRGRFELGGFRGEFTRIESRFAVFDPLYALNRGKSSFTVEGPGIDGSINGQCAFKQNVVTVGVVTFDAKKLAYVCEIAGDGRDLGTLTLGEPKPPSFKARVLARELRRGEAEVDSIRIGIESVHEYERSKLGSQTPVGYVLSAGAEVVGAIELTDTDPTLFLHPDASPATRRAALVTALALSVLRDPANSTLGD